ARPLSLVHVTPSGKRFVLALLCKGDAEPRRVLERASHQPAVLHAAATDGDRAGDVDVAEAGLAQVEDLAHDPGAIDRRIGVRHRDDRGEPAERGGARPGLDGLGLLVAGLAQVRVEVDEPWGDHAPGCVDHTVGGEVGPDRGDSAVVADHDVAAALAGRVDQPAASQHDRHCRSTPLPSNRYRTAMRTATPLRTWSITTERGRSATSAAISTPRFIGPGCITSVLSSSRSTR